MTMTTAVRNPAPAAAVAGANSPAAPQRPVRRVGSWTLGLVLIACGLCLLAYHFAPQFDYLLAAKLSPVVLVALGAEVLICAALPQKRKYDFFSIFVCLLLTAAALCVGFIPMVWQYVGPQRETACRTMEQQAEQQLYNRLRGSDVCSASVSISLRGAQQADSTLSFSTLDGTEWVYVSAELTGPYEDEAAFAAAGRTVADAVQALPLQVDELVVFSNRNYEGTDELSQHLSLTLDSPYKLDWDAAAMAAVVECSYRDIHGSQITKEQWLAGESADPNAVCAQYEDEYLAASYTAGGELLVTYKVDPAAWQTELPTQADPAVYEDEYLVAYPEDGQIFVVYKDPEALASALRGESADTGLPG